MIKDTTGIVLIPGNQGLNCPGNGKSLECCCDECDYLQCCLPGHDPSDCTICNDRYCPHAGNLTITEQ